MKKRCSKCGEVFEAEPDENWVIECTSCGARLRVRPKEPSPDEEEPARKTTSSSRIEKPQKTPSNASDRLKLPAVMRANKVVAGRTCPGCAEAIGLGTEVHNCDACGASHHAACWDAHGACASDECAAAPAKGRKGDREEEDED